MVKEADDASFESEVLQAGTPVLVDFTATWCHPCKKLEPIVKEVAESYGDRLKVVKVDVDRARATAARYGILSVPILMLFRDGTVRDQMTGVVSKGAISQKVDRVL